MSTERRVRQEFWAGLVDRLTGRGDRAVIVADRPEAAKSAAVIGNMGGKFRREEPQLLAAYEEVGIVRAVVGKISSSVAAVPWEGYRVKGGTAAARKFTARLHAYANLGPAGHYHRAQAMAQAIASGEVEKMDAHPVVALLTNASEFLTGLEIRKTLQASFEMTGNAFGLLRFKAGQEGAGPQVIDPVPTTAVKQTPIFLSATPSFIIGGPDFGGSADRAYPADRVLWLKDPSPARPYDRGSGIGKALGSEIDADEAAARTVTARFQNGGLPFAIVAYEGADRIEVERLERVYAEKARGYSGTGKPYFTSIAPKIEMIEQSMVDLDADALRKSMQNMIRLGWGVPPEIIGLIENSNRATIDAASFLFAVYTLIPRLDHWADNLNARVLPLFPGFENTFVWYASPVPEDLAARRELMGALPAAFTRDEVRASVGLPKRGEEDGEELMNADAPSAPAGAGQPETEDPAEDPAEAEAATDPTETEDPEDAADAGENSAAPLTQRIIHLLGRG